MIKEIDLRNVVDLEDFYKAFELYVSGLGLRNTQVNQLLNALFKADGFLYENGIWEVPIGLLGKHPYSKYHFLHILEYSNVFIVDQLGRSDSMLPAEPTRHAHVFKYIEELIAEMYED